jgi:hypothetical protein
MQPASHIDDDELSALIDQQLGPDESDRAQSHLAACVECQARLDGLRSVAVLLRRLPEVEPPRDFSLGPRLVEDPPNVVRLRRWYTATRVAAGALAAMFVVLAAGTLYVDSRPGSSAALESARPQAVLAPAANSQGAAPTVAARAAAPAAPAQAAAPAAGLSSARRPAANPQADDQVAAATSVSPLPTPPPTPPPTPIRLPISAPSVTSSSRDSVLTLGTAAVLAAVLAIIAVVIAIVVRQRLRRASHL